MLSQADAAEGARAFRRWRNEARRLRPAQLQPGPADLAGPRPPAAPAGASARAGRCPGCTARAGRPVGSGRHQTPSARSAFFVAEENTMSSFRALREVERGLFRSLCTGSRYFRTPEAGGKVDKDNPTQAGRALRQLGHVYSPGARGRSGRLFGALQKRLPRRLRLATGMANRFLKQVYLPDRRFATPPEGSAFVPFAGALDDILCVQRIVSNDNTARCKERSLQADRRHYVKATVQPYPRRLPRPRTPRPG